MADDWKPGGIDTSVAHPARMYDYFLSGKDNFEADRNAADQAIRRMPQVVAAAQANRRFLRRAVDHVARLGVRQFLDLGTGIPTSPNTHEVAQAVDPTARVVYADNDPIVLAHARALLTSSREGRTAYLDADLRDPEAILASPAVRDTLDLGEPVGLMLVAILHFIADEEDPYGIVSRLLAACPEGSYLILTHGSTDFSGEAGKALVRAYRANGVGLYPRPRAEVLPFFDGLDLLDPGLQLVTDWRPDTEADHLARPEDISWYGAVARKPGR